ncbi:MAG: TIGR02391 family protein [Rhodococcus sp. (in: high G+C Gram-positive bacteria)]|uniref:TIGR02391 family protein n=1 Tax=Rhodococcus baikonurensis TaxID=172041 RepID=A0ABV5XNN9_9NOCA|nr:TIGR02391 family protein [Rhodococcus sp. (in: high G+C Gram-positive bacteria)]REK81757.1 TIGR02391 family protein [Rhodococcus erythropolis]
MEHEKPWKLSVLTGVASVLGETDHGLTGRQIGDLLARLNMNDPTPQATKRDRLTNAFIAWQNTHQSPKRIITFITRAMAPEEYRKQPDLFTRRQDDLDEILTFVGLRITNKGEVAKGARSSTLDDAARNATSLINELKRRGSHQEVLRYCDIELLKKNNFHASMEACKSVFDRLRSISGADGDGAGLVDRTLAFGKSGVPVLAINTLRTQTDKDEQSGFANLLKGLSGMYRNPVAHDPRILRTVPDTELLELLTTLSMIHRRLDATVKL